MKTEFSRQALADPAMRRSEQILRTCVHCGFCTATCPTYLLMGDELDSPRGRIYLIKDMLENGRRPTPKIVKHIDRCLSCLSCMTTCPSGVHYMHLIDHARAYIQTHYRRPWQDRFLRGLLARIIPYPARLNLALRAAAAGRFATPLLRRTPGIGAQLEAMAALAPAKVSRAKSGTLKPRKPIVARAALLEGCAQKILNPDINAATRRFLARFGVEIVETPAQKCCGALVHHMGRERDAHAFAKANVDAWFCAIATHDIDAIVITASGCGSTIKDYGHMLRNDPEYAAKAAEVSRRTRDISEFVENLDWAASQTLSLQVAYHGACSLQHGQKVTQAPKNILRRAGFVVKEAAESHICCGSAGVYNVLQPAIAGQLRARKIQNLAHLRVDVVAAGNIGCITQLTQNATDADFPPVVHVIELLDWATGGPRPKTLETKIEA